MTDQERPGPARVLHRPPGGVLTAAALAALAVGLDAAGARARLEPHGMLALPEGAAGGAAPPVWGAAGGWHVLAAPLSGRVGTGPDVRGVAEELAAALDAAGGGPAVVAVDDGSGDIAWTGAAVTVLAAGDGTYRVHRGAAGGAPLHEGVPAGRLARHVAAAAEGAGRAGVRTADAERGAAAAARHIGWLAQRAEGAAPLVTLGAAVPDGELDPTRLEYLAAIGRPVRIGPARTLLLCDLDEWTAEQVVRVLAPMGFVFDADAPLVRELALSCARPSPGSATSAAP